MSFEEPTPAAGLPQRKLGTVKMFCRCGQKVRISLPSPKPSGRCPRCGHVFVLPQVPIEYQPPSATPAAAAAVPRPAQTPTASSAAGPTAAAPSSPGASR
ncbi:MAG TPA: hypothetical protein PK280_20200 [Planctomycetota bacterium]|nr:hypothetical protein [Planctomycetota bacterium]